MSRAPRVPQPGVDQRIAIAPQAPADDVGVGVALDQAQDAPVIAGIAVSTLRSASSPALVRCRSSPASKHDTGTACRVARKYTTPWRPSIVLPCESSRRLPSQGGRVARHCLLGAYDVSAVHQHTPPVHWALDTACARRSSCAHGACRRRRWTIRRSWARLCPLPDSCLHAMARPGSRPSPSRAG